MSENLGCSPFSFRNIFIRFGSNLYRQIVDIPIGTNCALLVGDSLMFCYEKQMVSQIYPTTFE